MYVVCRLHGQAGLRRPLLLVLRRVRRERFPGMNAHDAGDVHDAVVLGLFVLFAFLVFTAYLNYFKFKIQINSKFK